MLFSECVPETKYSSCCEGPKNKHSTQGVISTELSPAAHTISDIGQEAVDLLDHLGTLLAYSQPAINQLSQILSFWAAFRPLFLKPVLLCAVVTTLVQYPALSFVECHATTRCGQLIQPTHNHMQSLPTLKKINSSAYLSIICKPTGGALDPLTQITNLTK